MRREGYGKAAKKSSLLRLLSDYQLYADAKELIVREHFSGRYSKVLDDYFEESNLRNSNIFKFAMIDAQFLINSIDTYMKHLHVVDVKRIDFMSSSEINALIQNIGAAKRQPEITDEKVEVKTLLDIVGISRDNLVVCNVAGASMEGLISEGDTLFVDASATPQSGNIVVVDFDGNLLVKRLIRDNGSLWLHSDNPAFEPFKVEDETVLSVYGVVRKILKSC